MLLPEKPLLAEADDKKPDRSSSRRRIPREKRIVTSETKSRSMSDDKRCVTVVNEVEVARGMETPGCLPGCLTIPLEYPNVQYASSQISAL